MKDGSTYDGEWKNDVKNGKGTGKLKGATYVGEWKDGKAHGKGELTLPNGKKSVGEFRYGKFVGK
jgi:hypothetical protein